MINFIANHLVELLTLLIALAAVITAILSYLFRPTKIEVEKRHSDDLKSLIEQWKSEIVNHSIQNPFDIKANKNYSLDIPAEKELYFNDIKNHIPSDLKLFVVWEKFKENWKKYEENRHEFFKRLKDDISKKIDLSFTTSWDKKPGFSIHLIKHIYADLSSIFEGRKPYWVKYEGKIHKIDDRYEFKSDDYLFWSDKKHVAEKAKKSYYGILKNLQKSPYIKIAKKLMNDNKQLYDEREELIKKLNYLTFIPLLPGKCKYIKWSLPGVIENIKRKFIK